jgi:hypothetical protein
VAPYEVPTMGREGSWLALFGPTIFGLFYLGEVISPGEDPSPWRGAFLLVWWLVTAAVVADGRTAQVVLDGGTVTIRRRWTMVRFELDAVRWVIAERFGSEGVLRVDGAERRLRGLRLPRVAPWTQLVRTGVHPSYWVRHAGIAEERVRGGGIWFRRRGLP